MSTCDAWPESEDLVCAWCAYGIPVEGHPPCRVQRLTMVAPQLRADVKVFAPRGAEGEELPSFAQVQREEEVRRTHGTPLVRDITQNRLHSTPLLLHKIMIITMS